jgi:hypothetical protein
MTFRTVKSLKSGVGLARLKKFPVNKITQWDKSQDNSWPQRAVSYQAALTWTLRRRYPVMPTMSLPQEKVGMTGGAASSMLWKIKVKKPRTPGSCSGGSTVVRLIHWPYTHLSQNHWPVLGRGTEIVSSRISRISARMDRQRSAAVQADVQRFQQAKKFLRFARSAQNIVPPTLKSRHRRTILLSEQSVPKIP